MQLLEWNVIGGGDWAKGRLIPDYKKLSKNKKVSLRSPNSTRPWQHVLDVYTDNFIKINLKNKKNLNGQSLILVKS